MKEIDRMRILSGLEPTRAKKEQINEGWLQNLVTAVALLSASSGIAQSVQDLPYSQDTKNKIEVALNNPEITNKLKEMGVEDDNIQRALKRFKNHKFSHIKTRKAFNDEELAKYLRMGYHLTKIETDTIIDTIPEIAPNTVVEESVLTFNDNAFFESGSFEVENSEIQKIKQALDSIDNNNEVLLNVVVESSTDKQGLSKTLQKTLMSIGYSGDNDGLSKARNNVVVKVLNNQGVDSTLISQIILSEQGKGIINPNSRYVKVRFQYLSYEPPVVNPEKIDIQSSYPKTYELLKAISKHKTHKKHRTKTCKVSIKKFKKGQVLCPNF